MSLKLWRCTGILHVHVVYQFSSPIEFKTQREALDRTSNLPPEDVHGFRVIDVLYISWTVFTYQPSLDDLAIGPTPLPQNPHNFYCH